MLAAPLLALGTAVTTVPPGVTTVTPARPDVLTVAPAAGDPAGPWTWSLPQACPAPADTVRTVVAGPGVAVDPLTVVAGLLPGTVAAGPAPAPAAGATVSPPGGLLELLSAATAGTPPAAGAYDIEVQCLASGAAGPTPTGDLARARVDLQSTSAYRVLPADPVAARASVVVVAAAPAVTTPTAPLTLSATVAAGAGVPTGTVTFRLSPSGVVVQAQLAPDGTAQAVVAAPPVGEQQVEASYSGDQTHDAAIARTVVTSVDPAAPLATAITLEVAGGPYPDLPVDLTGTVTVPQGTVVPTGTCLFRQGTSPVAANVPVDAIGVCRYSTASLPSARPLVAEYVPAGPFQRATSAEASVPTSAVAAAATPQGLAISTPFTPDSPADFGTVVLDRSGTRWEAVLRLRSPGGVGGIRVIDARPDSNTFSLSMAVTPRADADPATTLPASALSLRDTGVRYLPGDRLDGLTPATSVTTFPVPAFGTQPVVVATGTGPGQVDIEGDLVVSLPTSVAPGTYTTVLTFTFVAGPPSS